MGLRQFQHDLYIKLRDFHQLEKLKCGDEQSKIDYQTRKCRTTFHKNKKSIQPNNKPETQLEECLLNSCCALFFFWALFLDPGVREAEIL